MEEKGILVGTGLMKIDPDDARRKLLLDQKKLWLHRALVIANAIIVAGEPTLLFSFFGLIWLGLFTGACGSLWAALIFAATMAAVALFAVSFVFSVAYRDYMLNQAKWASNPLHKKLLASLEKS
ncbi:MAG: hypothetical protein KGI60_02930 [Patescibacteria group bacterium]|nr:hypothetical protein [Patescibacteria group bacterium]